MNKLLFTALILFASLSLCAQQERYTQADTSKRYYSKTDFSNIDTLEFWQFGVDTTPKLRKQDSIHPIGIIQFWRSVPINDSVRMEIYDKLWTPSISYKIYNIRDSLYCQKLSRNARYISSCVPPVVGGDLIMLGDLILVNTSVCLNCSHYGSRIDYCRPVLNKVFNSIDDTQINTISSLEAQLGNVLVQFKKPK